MKRIVTLVPITLALLWVFHQESAWASVLASHVTIDRVAPGIGRSAVTWTVKAEEIFFFKHKHKKITVSGQLNEFDDCIQTPAIGIQRQTSHAETTGRNVAITKTLFTGTCVCAYRAEAKPDHDPDGVVLDEIATRSACIEGVCGR